MSEYIFNTVTSEIYKNFEIEVVKMINNTFFFWLLNSNDNNAYFNGYITIPKYSKYYGKEYDAINKEIEIHKGFTFSNFVMKELRNAVDQIIHQELKYDVEKVEKERVKSNE